MQNYLEKNSGIYSPSLSAASNPTGRNKEKNNHQHASPTSKLFNKISDTISVIFVSEIKAYFVILQYKRNLTATVLNSQSLNMNLCLTWPCKLPWKNYLERGGTEEKVTTERKWNIHHAGELDDVHAKPSFVFPGWLAEWH